ncbi:hypothetical protein [Anaerotruncus colihominis]|uniref:hypothetical protein n=1 Tax=Anaerotruncus colihominis TaxID=169435 RepID=UPI001897EF99|nr:hypothetical protein [Anaerotruncus colihominis]
MKIEKLPDDLQTADECKNPNGMQSFLRRQPLLFAEKDNIFDFSTALKPIRYEIWH